MTSKIDKSDPWWDCPSCGATTEIGDIQDPDTPDRECPECEWSVTIPQQTESDQG